nr:helix-hairpin-helix domain-containing protein [uncultured Bacteroides sp.]
MRNPLKDFLYFSRRERQGILVLITGIILLFLSGYIYTFRQEHKERTDEEIQLQVSAVEEYEDFIASVREKDNKREFHSGRYPISSSSKITLTSFNPNTADSATFRKLGLPGWMVKNILRYRSKGGKFRKAEDFKKIYGLEEEQYENLLPYLYITPEDTMRNTARLYNSSITTDSTKALREPSYKYPVGTVINLNLADTIELKKIPGIGSGIARLIVGYRRNLGGFYRIEQLQDINLDYRQLENWFCIHDEDIRLINLNRSGVERLRNHPYINFYQAKVFVEYRKKKGTLHSLKPFTLYEEFTEDDLEKISHYVCFD